MTTTHYRAAGGIVRDEENRVLLLERDVEREGERVHEVRLPKGHVEDDESDREAALREVCEESGFCDLMIVADLRTIRSEYEFRGTQYVRDEHYFLMRLSSRENRGQDPAVGKEEVLFECTWAPDLEIAAERLTYESEREFARRAQFLLRSGNDTG